MSREVDYLEILQSDRDERRIVAGRSRDGSAPVVYAAGLTAEARKGSTQGREAKMAKGKKKGGKKKSKGKKLSKAARAEISRKNLAKARSAKRAKAKAKTHGKPKAKKAKAKRTAKQKAASKANIKKAQSALRKKAKGKAVRAPKMPKHAPVRQAARKGKGKKGGKRSKGKLTKAQRREISMRNLRKAQAARRRNKKEGRKHKVGAYSYPVKSKTVKVPTHKSWEGKGHKQTRKQRAASLRNIKKAQAARRRGGSRAAEAPKSKGKKKGKRKQTQKQRAASLRNLVLAQRARKNATKRHNVKGYSYHRQGGQRHVPGHMSYEYAMENPLTVKEFAWGAASGLGWFWVTDAVDRFWATHPLTSKTQTDAQGHALYADVPITAATIWTGYPGVYNDTAICAPMNLVRWGSGILMIAVPLVGARFVEHPLGRSVLQTAGFGALLRIGGKAGMDLIARLLMWTQSGQRLYNGELRSQVLTSADQSALSSLPSAGLGAVLGCGTCPSCVLGVGSCASAGVGYPSMPREAAAASSPTSTTPATSNQPVTTAPPPPPPVPPTPTATTTTTPTSTSPLMGVQGLPPKRTSVYDWGHKEEVVDRDRDAA